MAKEEYRETDGDFFDFMRNIEKRALEEYEKEQKEKETEKNNINN